jgi:MYXO-CTERM domain-containing protein
VSRRRNSVFYAAVFSSLGLTLFPACAWAAMITSGENVDGWNLIFPPGLTVENTASTSGLLLQMSSVFDDLSDQSLVFVQNSYSAAPTITIQTQSIDNQSGFALSGLRDKIVPITADSAGPPVITHSFVLSNPAAEIFTSQTIASNHVAFHGTLNNGAISDLGSDSGGGLKISAAPAASGTMETFSLSLIPLTAASVGDVNGPTWINASDGDWSTGGNWSTGAVPQTGDDVSNTLTSTISYDTTASINRFADAGGLRLDGGVLSGTQANSASPVTVNGNFAVTGGTLKNLTVQPGGYEAVRFGGPSKLSSMVFNATGVFKSTTTLAGNDTINGKAKFMGGTFSMKANSSLKLGGAAMLYGYGRVGGAGAGTTLTNNGAIDANVVGQTLSIDGGVTSFINEGSISVLPGASLAIGAPWTNSGGTIQTDGLLTYTGGLNLTMASGLLDGTGTLDSDLISTGATVSPGDNAAGHLTVTGNYNQGALGVLAINVAGYDQGGNYSLLTVQGQATLGGTLDLNAINGFVPQVGDQFTILDAGSAISGTFLNLTSDTGLGYTVSFTGASNNQVQVTITSVPSAGGSVPEPAEVAFLGAAGLGVLACRRRRRRHGLSSF